MSARYSEKGDVMAVVFGILIVALMAALGFIFYQNFLANDDQKADETQQIETTPDDSETTTQLAFDSTIYEMSYPKSWLAVTSQNAKGQPVGSTITITNPDQTVRVKLGVSAAKNDTPCTPSDLNITYYSVGKNASKTLAPETLYLVEAIVDHKDGGYGYAIGLTPEGGDTHAAIGQPLCNVARVGYASALVLADDGSVAQPSITATIDFPKLPIAPKPASKDMQGIKDLMATDDYKKAVRTIESAHKK